MTIWAIADIHGSKVDPASGRPSKPMDIFGDQWKAHMEKLEGAWSSRVVPEDTVIVAGDTDWALHLEDARETLHRLDEWNGTKLLLRGNHDYWWSSKATNRVRQQLPPSLHLIHNNAFPVEGFNICGAKGSPVPGAIEWTPENEKLLNREVQRLKLSLDERDPALPTIVAIHYAPFYPSTGGSPYREMFEAESVACVVYGHLHGQAAASGPHGRYGVTEYRLVAADAVDFAPVQIARWGELLLEVG